MTASERSDAVALLDALVGHASVVGRPNLDLVAFVRRHLAEHGIAATVIDGPEGDRQALFATIGPADRPGYVISAHLDVVPADEPGWTGDPFVLRCEGERLIGRGTTDMKGFVAAVLSLVPELVRRPLERPVHIALSYDEEAGCRGVGHLIARLPELCAPPLGCLVGEPTGLRPVLRHKGKAAIRVFASGIAGHSARPDQGSNAIHALVPVLDTAVRQARHLGESGPRDAAFVPPHSTLQVGRIEGGYAVNAIPEACIALVEARCVPEETPLAALAPVLAAAEAAPDVAVEVLSQYPGLAQGEGAEIVALVRSASGRDDLSSVSFGTEAGLYAEAGLPSVVCGPGDMARGHRPDEYLTRAELRDAQDFVSRFTDLASRA